MAFPGKTMTFLGKTTVFLFFLCFFPLKKTQRTAAEAPSRSSVRTGKEADDSSGAFVFFFGGGLESPFSVFLG